MSQITIQNLYFTYDGDHTPVFENLNLRLDTNWKLGLVGRNGRGKTTLLRLLAGELEGRGTVALNQPCLRWPRPVEEPDWRTMDILLEGVPPEEEWRLVWELSKLGLEEVTAGDEQCSSPAAGQCQPLISGLLPVHSLAKALLQGRNRTRAITKFPAQ